ncbi:OmpH family outer membrane protein [Thermovibrio sp.]
MRKLLVLTAVLATLTGAPSLQGAFAKERTVSQFAVYFVDMQKIVNQSAKGKQAKSLLKGKIAKAKKKIKELEKEIKQIKNELQSPALSKEAKEKKENLLQQKIRELQRYQQDAQIEIANLERKYTMEIINEAVKVIKNYQKSHHIPMIVEAREAGIIAADPKYDLTQTIIDIMNKQAQ